MPGSIKIDDGSGNYTILTNAGSLSSDKTLTIPNETATLATTTATDLGALVKITSATASNSSEVLFDNFVDTSTYCSYKIIVQNVVMASAGAILRLVFRSGGASGSDITGSYLGMQWASFGNVATSGFDSNFSQSGAGDTTFSLPSSAGAGTHGCIIDFYPCDGTHGGSSFWSQIVGKDNGGNTAGRVRARHVDDQTACTGAKFISSSGNITSATFTVFGVRK